MCPSKRCLSKICRGTIANHKYKLMHFVQAILFYKEKKALAFNQDRCCHLAVCLLLLLLLLFLLLLHLSNNNNNYNIAATVAQCHDTQHNNTLQWHSDTCTVMLRVVLGNIAYSECLKYDLYAECYLILVDVRAFNFYLRHLKLNQFKIKVS